MRSAFSTSRPPESLRRARPRPGPAGAPLWPRRGRAASDRGALEPVRRRHGTRFGRGWDEGGLQAQVENLRLPGRTVLPIVLSWVRPDAFPPPRACTPETPVLDPKKTAKLLDAYGAHLLQHRSRRSDPPGCPMFSSSMETRKRTMLQPCCPTRLQRAIICCSRDTSSNPHKEMLAFAQAEPEATRHALRSLFDEKEAAHRAHLSIRGRDSTPVRATPRPSLRTRSLDGRPHGNYYTACGVPVPSVILIGIPCTRRAA